MWKLVLLWTAFVSGDDKELPQKYIYDGKYCYDLTLLNETNHKIIEIWNSLTWLKGLCDFKC